MLGLSEVGLWVGAIACAMQAFAIWKLMRADAQRMLASLGFVLYGVSMLIPIFVPGAVMSPVEGGGIIEDNFRFLAVTNVVGAAGFFVGASISLMYATKRAGAKQQSQN